MRALQDILAQLEAGHFEAAAQAAARLSRQHGDDAQAHRLHGIALLQLGQAQAAIVHLQRARALAPAAVEILANLASAQLAAGQVDAALATLTAALRLAPTHPALLNQYGNLLHAQGDLAAAARAYRDATQAQNDHVGAWCNLAACELALGDEAAAERDLRHALAIAPGYPPALLLLGQLHVAHGETEAAEQAFLHGQRGAPADARFAYQLGLLAEERKHLARAAQLQAQALALEPGLHAALGQLVFLRRQLCDWRGLAALSDQLRERVAAGAAGIAPFGFLAEPASAIEQLQCARIAAAQIEQNTAPLRARLPAAPPAPLDARLRLGLVSNGFGNHPTGLLCVAVVEALREHGVEVHLFATSKDDGGPIRARLHAAAQVHLAAGLGAFALAQRMRAQALDVLVDLRGYGGGSVAESLALRPAPLQAAWFAYPGTSGAPWIDYLIADRSVLPASIRSAFSESIAYLPRCFQPSDPSRGVAEPPPRDALGLPREGTVFACFNNSYKLNPKTFERLLQVLRCVAGSVLWLLEGPEGADQRLRETARDGGVDPARLVFQGRLPHARYLALYRHADLFLDTAPYGAHTTASDAIWAGCPVLTVAGDTFASRVATSLNHHLGMPQLNLADDASFITKAISLGVDAQARGALRAELAQRRGDSGLFDMHALARDLAALLQRMVARQRAGLAPTDLD